MCLDIFNGGPNNNQPHLARAATTLVSSGHSREPISAWRTTGIAPD
jgi:hypothetical protein